MPAKNKETPSAKDEAEVEYTEENKFGDWIRLGLSQKKINVSELGEKSGVSQPAIYNILSGKSLNPQTRTIEKIASVIGNRPEKEDKLNILTDAGFGELIDFDPYDENGLPDCNGVYVFYDITDRPVYVGRSTAKDRNIGIRVKEHYEKFWFKRPIVNNAAYIRINESDLCINIEKALIRFLKSNAVLNKQNVLRE